MAHFLKRNIDWRGIDLTKKEFFRPSFISYNNSNLNQIFRLGQFLRMKRLVLALNVTSLRLSIGMLALDLEASNDFRQFVPR